MFEKWYPIDLLKPPSHAYDLGTFLYTGDALSALVGVEVTRGGEEVALEGSVKGIVILPDGTGVPQFDGYTSGNKAWITLPELAMVMSGRITIAIRLVNGDEKTVLLGASATVRRTDADEWIDPSHIVPTWDDIYTKITQMDQAKRNCDDATTNANQAATDARTAMENAVQYTAQTKDASAQAVARGNIGAADAETVETLIPIDELAAPIALEHYYVRHSDGTRSSNVTYNATARVSLAGCTKILYRRTGVVGGTSTAGTAFYDSNGDYVSGIGAATRQEAAGYQAELYEAEVPAGAAYAAFTTYANTDEYGEFRVYGVRSTMQDALAAKEPATVEEAVSGAAPSIIAFPNHRYVCGTLDSLSFTPSAEGLCEVIFTAGSDMVLSLPSSVRMPDWWTGVEAGRTYDLMILDGVYGAVMSWA